MPTEDSALRTQLTQFLNGGQAHADVGSALKDFPVELAGEKPHGLPYSAWQLVEHMRFTLNDLLEFVTNSEYEAPKWPDAYWPKEAEPASREAWEQSVRAIHENLKAFADLVSDTNSNLYDVIPWADSGQTLLREVLLVIDHNSYHTGELIVLRRLLGVWKK